MNKLYRYKIITNILMLISVLCTIIICAVDHLVIETILFITNILTVVGIGYITTKVRKEL